MTDQPLHPVRRPFPWLKVLLVASLALNLLVGGAAVARFFTHEPPGRLQGISEMQLIPRKFFGDLDGGRRKELMAVFRGFRGEFNEGREARKQLANALVAALAAEPYDERQTRAAVAAFNERSAALVTRGGDAAMEFIAKLTPDERKLLARRIAERVGGERGSHHR